MKDRSSSAIAAPTARLARQIQQRKRPLQERSQATVKAILEATFRILRKEGMAALTTTRVAEVAGVSVGSIYQYFPNKRSLVTALKLQYFERVTGRILAAIEAARGLPLAEAVRRVIGELLAAKRDNRDLALALKAPMAEIGGPSFIREAARLVSGSLEALLRAADPTAPRPELATRVGVGALEGVIAAAVEDSPASLADPAFEDELVALALGYLQARR
jgi:AcrR family transcriptional regulator